MFKPSIWMTDLKASWKISSSNALRALVAAWLLVAGGYAAAQSSDAAFAEGVRLARDGAHRAAVRQYRQAIAGGQDSPLVQYNLGVALYRLDDFTAAETAFRRAAEDPALAPLALHNLGLVHYAAGEHAAAERAFAAAAACSPAA